MRSIQALTWLSLSTLAGCSSLFGSAEHANLTVVWNTQNVDGTQLPCNTNYPMIMVHVMNYSKSTNGNESEFTRLFECSAGQGTWSLPLSGDIEEPGGLYGDDVTGAYDVWISQRDSSGEVARQESQTNHHVDLSTGDKTVTNTFYEDGGYYGVEWEFRGTEVTEDLTCAASGVDTVKVIATNAETKQVTEKSFPCDNRGESHAKYDTNEVIWLSEGSALLGPFKAGMYTYVLKGYTNGVEVATTDEDPGAETMLGLTAPPYYSGYELRVTTR